METNSVEIIAANNRFYENKYPEVDECVAVKIIHITESGITVNLLEYGNIEGMILLSEVSRMRMRSINKFITVGSVDYAIVLRIDEEKGYIDLSKRLADFEDINECKKRYSNSKLVNLIINNIHIALRSNQQRTSVINSVTEIYELVVWPLTKVYGTSFDSFKEISNNGTIINSYVLDDSKSIYTTEICKKFAPKIKKISAVIEVCCFTYEGIDAIKESLTVGKLSNDLLVINAITSPAYSITINTSSEELGVKIINNAINIIRTTIQNKKGSLKVKISPQENIDTDKIKSSYEEIDEKLDKEIDEEIDKLCNVIV
jgi:translation initiation factor 2 subunit 1